jgi:ubiquinone/menaquinone biosynthesis C-methylase UbiE
MSLWGRVFASLYDRMCAASEEAGLREMRAQLLAGARGRALEIGAGTGLNLGHYGDAVTDLVLTEPEEPMARRLERSLAGTGRGARVVRAPAEALPFDDGAFDTVVSTLVLCTAADPRLALAEAARVLAPGGRLLFLEHVRSGDPGRARSQDRWAPLWRRVGHGCRCNQDTEALLRAAPGLTVERLEPTSLPKAAPIVRPAISGSAARRAA